MSELFDLVFSCASNGELTNYSNEISSPLPRAERSIFRKKILVYISKYSLGIARQKLNGRTLRDIMSDGESFDQVHVASGEVDGVGYTLYPGTSEPAERSEPPEPEGDAPKQS